MTEIARLKCESEKMAITLVLTPTHLMIEPSPEFTAKVSAAMAKGRMGAEQATGVIGWIVNKALNVADSYIERLTQPHKLEDVDLIIKQNNVTLRIPGPDISLNGLEVDKTEAFIFDAKFLDAKEALTRK